MSTYLKINICNLLIIALFGVMIQSCDDVEELAGRLTTVGGSVTDYYTKKGISDVMMVIKNEDSHSDPFVYTRTYYDTIFADSNGKYHYEFINDTCRSYSIIPISPEKYSSLQFGQDIWEGAHNVCNFHLKSFRSLKLHVVNQERKWTKCTILNFQTIGKYLQEIQLSGTDIDTILNIKIIPEERNELGISLTKENDSQVGQFKNADLIFYSLSNRDTTMTFNY